MHSIQGRPPHGQEGTPAECHHARAGFDALFHTVGSRADVGPAAKLVYGKLVSLHRLGLVWTQAEIGEAVGLSRHQVWRALGELVRAELVVVSRPGQGHPNEYTLLGLDQRTLDGRDDRASRSRPVRRPVAGRSGVPSFMKKKGGKEHWYTQPPRTSADLMMTRYGPLRR